MKLSFSRKTIQKIAIGVVVLIVLLFIFIKFWRKSGYTVTNTAEDASSYPITGVTLGASTGVNPNQYKPLTITVGTHVLKAGDLVKISGLSFTPTVTAPAPFVDFLASTAYPAGASTAALVAGEYVAYVESVPAGNTTFIMKVATTTLTATLTTGAVVSVFKDSLNKLKYTDAIECQKNFATDIISAPQAIISADVTVGVSAEGVKYTDFTVNLGPTFDSTAVPSVNVNDKFLIAGLSDGSPIICTARTAVTAGTVTAGNFTSLDLRTERAIAASITITKMTPIQLVNTAFAQRELCVLDAATTYTVNHCRYLPQPANAMRPGVPTAADDPRSHAAYMTYQDDIKAIQQAYAPIIARIQQSNQTGSEAFPKGVYTPGGTTIPTFSVTNANKIVEAARKADLAGATRKYLASVCPGFYGQQSGETQTDYSATYKAWVRDTTASTVKTARKFIPSLVTDANIMKWAKFAGDANLSGPVTAVVVKNGGAGYASTTTAAVTAAATGGGTGAQFKVIVESGVIKDVIVTAGGTGYSSSPSITFTSSTTPTTAAQVEVLYSSGLNASQSLLAAAGATFTALDIGGTVNYSISGNGANYNVQLAAADALLSPEYYYDVGTPRWRLAYDQGPATTPIVY